MKIERILLVALLCLVFGTEANALKLVWDAPEIGEPTGGEPTGYVVYSRLSGTVATPFSEAVMANQTEYPLEPSKFEPGKTYDFWVTAFNDAGESQPSNTVDHTFDKFVPPDNPMPVVITIPKEVTIRFE
jgi:hypothetical protein